MHRAWSWGSKAKRKTKEDVDEVVWEDVQVRKLNKEDAIDRCKWRKMIKDVRWSGWVWLGECFFWYRPTRVVPDKRPLNGCVCVCLSVCLSVCVCVCLSVSLSLCLSVISSWLHYQPNTLPSTKVDAWRKKTGPSSNYVDHMCDGRWPVYHSLSVWNMMHAAYRVMQIGLQQLIHALIKCPKVTYGRA